ncbi:MAG: ferrochelatase [Chloroherpetonaceae bacterium]|nr:ferrochelatase [Chloroherpetonaceae bacterium]
MSKTNVILVAHGEGETIHPREHFRLTKRIFHHAEKLVAIPKALQTLIAGVGSIALSAKWALSGYRSPHNKESRHLCESLILAWNKNASIEQVDFKLAYSSTPPYFEDVLSKISEDENIIVVSLTPVNSDFSCGILCEELFKKFSKSELLKFPSRAHTIGNLWNRDELLEVYLQHILDHRAGVSTQFKSGLIIALHGTVVRDSKGKIPSFNTGLNETLEFADRMKKRFAKESALGFNRIEEAYLNHNVGGEWTVPTLKDTIRTMKLQGIEEVVFFAGGYFSDNSETDHASLAQLKKAGFKKIHSLPCINSNERFVIFLKNEIEKALSCMNRWKNLSLPLIHEASMIRPS